MYRAGYKGGRVNTLLSRRSVEEDLGPRSLKDGSCGWVDCSDQIFSTLAVCGLKTQLYRFQQASVLSMLHCEGWCPKPIAGLSLPRQKVASGTQTEADILSSSDADPSSLGEDSQEVDEAMDDYSYAHIAPVIPFVPVTDTDGKDRPVRGGILCEEMGSGKTLMCLALILATKNTRPAPPCGSYQLLPPDFSLNVDEAIFPLPEQEQAPKPVPSLFEMCMDLFMSGRIRGLTCALPEDLTSLLDSRGHCSYLKFQETPRIETRRSSSSAGHSWPPKRLVKATVLVVRDNLLVQWADELCRHMHIESLDIYIVDKPGTVLDADRIASCDLVLFTFRTIGSYFSPDAENTGPFREFHFLRVIVDEGHVLAKNNTSQTALLSGISAERRWVVSGTPVSGSSTREISSLLGLLHFLKHPMVKNSTEKRRLSRQIQSSDEVLAESTITQLVQELCVRNKVESISKEVSLPGLNVRTVMLEPDDKLRRLYNQYVVPIRVNLITSLFEGPDCFLHPKNARYGTTVFLNLQLACFDTTSLAEANMTNLRQVILEDLEKGAAKHTPESLAELRKLFAIIGIPTAMMDRYRKVIVPTEPESILLVLPHPIPVESMAPAPMALSPSLPDLEAMTPPIPSSQVVSPRGLISEPDSICLLVSHPLAIEEDDQQKFYPSQKLQVVVAMDDAPKRRDSPSKRRASFPQTPQKRKKPDGSSIPSAATPPPKKQYQLATTPEKELLSKQRKRYFLPGSSKCPVKLGYLIERVKSLVADGNKVIVFSKFDSVVKIAGMALEFHEIKTLNYSAGVSEKDRAQIIADFNTKQGPPVLVMNLDLAAYGINLPEANHLIFVEPPLDPNTERQAIARALRIGQSRVVEVERLVIRGTVEDLIASGALAETDRLRSLLRQVVPLS